MNTNTILPAAVTQGSYIARFWHDPVMGYRFEVKHKRASAVVADGCASKLHIVEHAAKIILDTYAPQPTTTEKAKVSQ